MKEGLFLSWIALNSADIARGHHQAPAFVISDPANPIQSGQYQASMAAGQAPDLIVREAIVYLAFPRIRLQNALE